MIILEKSVRKRVIGFDMLSGLEMIFYDIRGF
jgi:hypothetical protein